MKKTITVLAMAFLLLLEGCSSEINGTTETVVINDKEETTAKEETSSDTSTVTDVISASGEKTDVELGEGDVRITSGGTYEFTGTLKDGSIIVEAAEDEDVNIILNGVDIYSEDFACIYIISADEVLITLAEGSVNSLRTGSSYSQIDENTVDAVIYSKADTFFDGTGKLVIEANAKHAIVSKDDLIILSGTYEITAMNHALYGKDLVEIYDGTFTLNCGTDAVTSDSEEDGRGNVTIHGGNFKVATEGDGFYAFHDLLIEGGSFAVQATGKALKADGNITVTGGDFTIDSVDDAVNAEGDVLIEGGSFRIDSDDDGIHGDASVTINGGEFVINAHEAIESTVITINDGTFDIYATDDAINAGQKVNNVNPCITINGGTITIDMGQGDTDAIDSNGNITINGGTIDITAQSPFDYDGQGQFNGGTLIVNGSETTTMSNQFMGGMGMMGGMMPGGNGGMMPGGGNGGHGPGGR